MIMRKYPEQVIAVDGALAEETRNIIGAERVIAEAAFGSYSVFRCTVPEGLIWNGHFLTQ